LKRETADDDDALPQVVKEPSPKRRKRGKIADLRPNAAPVAEGCPSAVNLRDN